MNRLQLDALRRLRAIARSVPTSPASKPPPLPTTQAPAVPSDPAADLDKLLRDLRAEPKRKRKHR